MWTATPGLAASTKKAYSPSDIPDFYKGLAVTLYGRFDPATDKLFAFRLTGRAADKKKEVIFAKDFSEAEKGTEDIARKWAFAKIYHLIGETTRLGETPELQAEIRGLSKQFGIQTSYDE